MIPVLLTIGHGIVWLITTLAGLMIWGFGLVIGMHFGKMAIEMVQSRNIRYWRKRAIELKDKNEAVAVTGGLANAKA